MRTRGNILGAGVLLAVFLSSVCPAGEPPSLVGEWAVVAMERDGKAMGEINYAGMRWTFANDSLKLHPGRSTPAGLAGRPPLECSYVVDDTQSPRRLDWTCGEGEKKQTIKAIYELKNDVLRICFVRYGKVRPEGFGTKDTDSVVYRLKREKAK